MIRNFQIFKENILFQISYGGVEKHKIMSSKRRKPYETSYQFFNICKDLLIIFYASLLLNPTRLEKLVYQNEAGPSAADFRCGKLLLFNWIQ